MVRPRTDMTELQLQLSTLDSMEQAFLFLDSKLVPQFLSSKAARILGVRHRYQLRNLSDVLGPLVEIALRSAKAGKSSFSRDSQRGLEQVVLLTLDQRRIKIFARANPISLFGRAAPSGYVVAFYDLVYIEPLRQMLSLSRRSRLMLVEIACKYGFDSLSEESASKSAESFFVKRTGFGPGGSEHSRWQSRSFG